MILNTSEYLGTVPPLFPSTDFVNMICDTPFIGSIYTWCCLSSPPIVKRVDNVNPLWNVHFHTIFVEHLYRALSDHSPLLISSSYSCAPFCFSF